MGETETRERERPNTVSKMLRPLSQPNNIGPVWKQESKVMKVFHFTKKEITGCLFGWHMDEFESKYFKTHDFFSLMNVDLK